MAGHADLAAAGLEQHALVEIGPRLDLLRSGGLEAGKRDRGHGDCCERTSVLAGRWFGARGSGGAALVLLCSAHLSVLFC